MSFSKNIFHKDRSAAENGDAERLVATSVSFPKIFEQPKQRRASAFIITSDVTKRGNGSRCEDSYDVHAAGGRHVMAEHPGRSAKDTTSNVVHASTETRRQSAGKTYLSVTYIQSFGREAGLNLMAAVSLGQYYNNV